MKVIKAFPPNFAQIASVFPVKGMQGIIYAYGDRIYNPSGVNMEPWIVAHEEVHGGQQASGEGYEPAKWWDHYIADPEFRLAQELPAHRAEWQEYLRVLGFTMASREKALERMAIRLSSPLYGSMVTKEWAEQAILRPNE